ncbi:protocadherin Fat 4 isoform X2 [Dicentrarchus labrax]|uniref:protocadherin Fat 4 isoform X2 n=1 Tax=Dicentrarchus labrax TaxID=13489 RepID=UPI0021F5DD09|nr:protocadherin Fat 4 isoform X2 [Dicentrarchus labrax]
MESTGQWRKYTFLMFVFLVFNTTSSPSSGNRVNVSSERQFADIVLRQHTLPSWYYTSDAVPKHGTVSLHAHNRWRTQMAFSKTVHSFEVKEDTVPGTVVGKVETVFETLTPITYSVQEDDGENLFLLSPLSGEFLLSRSLDFEAQSFYILTVVVQQGVSQVSSVRVYFSVLDVNDNPPVFSQDTFSASLLEDTQVGTCFLSLNVSDKDEGDNGDLKLRVVGGDEEEVFYINPAGSLCLNTELDRERQSFYNLTVTANDCVQPVSLQFTSTAHAIVLVNDVNDNAPLFVSAKLVSIPEDTALHSVIMIVHAEDEDIGSNGEVLYYLNNTSGGLFSIDNRSGKIYLEEELDREQEDTLTITITAIDEGSPRRATTMNFTMHVEDANDHDPEFSESTYSLTVREDIPRGTSLFQVQALDRDIGTNGQVRYILTQTSPFVVDTIRGVITVMHKLDRERDSNYTFIITAVDQGNIPRSATAAISVTVLDVNDFAPLFTPETLTVHVTENEDPSQLTQVSALDEDLGVNSQLTYFIQEGNSDGLFFMTSNGTFQIVHSLDREKESLYIVTIIAVDSGVPPLTGSLTIHVIVDDINDNHPEFTEEVYNTIVSEDSPTGTVFAMMTAFDIDEGVSGEIRYSMENPDVPFAIDETSGELFTVDVLDREKVAIYRLMVIGSDKHPTQPLSSSVLVTVLIGDVNDHWPQFMNSPYVAYVPTDLTPGSVVCAVRATDGDTEMNAELQYSLYGQSSDLFSISPYSGTVFTSSALQRIEDIIVNVHVEDAGENPKFDITTISIRFQNVSEFPEMNVDVLSYSLSEDEPVGTLVAVVSAASIRAEPISFYLASGNFEDMFHVEQLSGALTVENPLDYENKKEFTLLIEARDSGSPPFSSFAEIHLNISDVNDNFPQFTQVEYRCEVFENSSPFWVCDVLALDADSGTYGTVQYSITEGNTDNFFTVDPEIGLLSTIASLDRENIPEFNLTVEAAELNNPLHKDRANVIVVVLDRNDNAPRFSQIYLTEVPEDSPVGHTILQVTSTDYDTGPNAVINYFITDQSDDVPFNIDFTTGYITVERLLDREMQDHYILKVNANDSAWSISTDVTIVITDVNDNRPEFSDNLYSVILPETKDKEVFVLQVLATDEDLGQNSEILYVIKPPNEEFWVNASSGEIYTKQPLMLHNSTFEIYQFTVTAFDCGSVPLYSNASVTVRLEPYNYYLPTFLPFQPLIAIPYDMAVGTEVVKFTALDEDFNNISAGIEYLLNGGNASNFFWIQANNGKVMLNQSLLESVNLFLTLLVMAQDHGSPSLSSQIEITFEITAKNQFSPSFREPDVTFSVPEDLSIGSVIGKIQAEDMDYGPNGAIMYCITPENQYLPFSVGEASGLLTLIRELDYETEGIYHLQIKAMDGGWVSKTGILNVTVVVMDVNDNPPVFSSSEYTTSVPENSEIGTNVIDVKAFDADSGANAQISYSLTAGYVDKFAIDSRNGTITTLDVFDFEREQIFDITIKASNIGGHTLFSLAHVVIQISDVNEFTPTFRKKEFNFSVFKNVPVGTRVGKVTATDDDQGSEGQVFYLMFGQNKYLGFEINKLSGEIYTTASLRKQGNSHIVLKVLAKNSGVITGMDIDETLVHISVIDTNDAPIFTSALYSANVTEDSPVGTSVITVSALDQDSILDWNRFFFSIENGNANFSFAVDPSSGVISVNSPLDRELWPFYNLTVTATDNGSPPATGTTVVIVTIDDVNDNAPKLTFTEAQVKENQPQGTIVARLNASDSDLPPNQGPFTYWLVNPSTGSAFSLTPNGVLFTTRTIDREQISVYRVLVAVRDAGMPLLSSTTMLHIKIVDENDNPSLPRNIFIEVKYFGSSFQGGMIGKVHPEDQDESDTFNCAIISGSLNMFTIPYGTCELWSSPFQGEATFNITIEATDHLHLPVNNSIYVNYKGFTNASINSCIFFYVSSSLMEEFLSNKYLRFVKALDSLFNLQASKTHVFGIKHIGRQILLLAAVKNYNGQYLSREVASGISAGHKKLLETQSNVTISHITSDPCLTSPCQNGATCNKNIYISQDVAVLESLAVIFVSPQKELFNCTCPDGFTGTLCEEDIDECEVNPCENKGTCVNTPGGFYCHCQSGFSGSVCTSDVDECLKLKCQNGGTCIPTQDGYHCQCVPGFEGEMCEQLIDHCRSTPCVQGSCINSQTGFSCHCPFGVSGVHCEEHSYGFEELSFMEFPLLDRRTNLISLEFATVQRNSLLLYNPGGPSSREFFALEILDGAIHLSYDLGSGPVRLQTNRQVADGYFHSVTARRIGNMGSLHVDNCTDVENNGFCFSQSDGRSLARTLDVGSNMTFGGLRSFESILLHPAQIKTHDFVGCIRNIHVNGILLRPSMALATYNILDSCPRATPSACHSDPCKNGGMCHDLWSDYLCECKSPFTGSNCAKEMSEEVVLRFNGNDYIEYVIKERFKRDYLLKDLLDDEKKGNTRDQTVNIKFKTQDNGVLMSVVGQTGYVMLKIIDRRPAYIFKDTLSGHLSEFTVDSPVADGVWHVLSLVSNGQNTSLLLDGKPGLNISDGSIDLTPVSVEKIIFGAALTGFTGCVQYFNVTNYTLPVSGHSMMVDVWPSPSLVQSSCSSPGVCLSSPCSEEDTTRRGCLSAHCQNQWRCGHAVQNSSCICLHNVSDHACDICISTTESHDQCSEAQGSVPLWLIAVVLPLISILVIIGMFVTLYRVRRQNAKCQSDSSPQKTEQGTDNVAFCFDTNRTLTGVASAEEEKQHDSMGADPQRKSEFYCDASLSSAQPVPNNELEYYEIGSISSAFHSDTASLKLSWHKHLYSTKCLKAEPKRWGDLRMLLAGFKKDHSSEERAKSPAKPQNVASLNKQLLTKIDAEQSKHTSPSYKKRFLQPEFLEPVQCLTFEEISKLNTPLEQTMSHRASPRSGNAKCTTMIDVSSDSETDSTFTGTESECRQFSVTSTGKYIHEQSSLSGCSFKQQGILPVSSFLKHTSQSAAGLNKAEGAPSSMFEQWENILNMHLPFSNYAPVFEDIACLPSEPSHSYDMQSDIEEII